MITVRFSTGFSIQYNSANWWTQCAEFSNLYSDVGRTKWVAQVPNSCVIEAVQPCRTYFAGTPDFAQQLQQTEKAVKSLTRKIGKVQKVIPE